MHAQLGQAAAYLPGIMFGRKTQEGTIHVRWLDELANFGRTNQHLSNVYGQLQCCIL